MAAVTDVISIEFNHEIKEYEWLDTKTRAILSDADVGTNLGMPAGHIRFTRESMTFSRNVAEQAIANLGLPLVWNYDGDDKEKKIPELLTQDISNVAIKAYEDGVDFKSVPEAYVKEIERRILFHTK